MRCGRNGCCLVSCHSPRNSHRCSNASGRAGSPLPKGRTGMGADASAPTDVAWSLSLFRPCLGLCCYHSCELLLYDPSYEVFPRCMLILERGGVLSTADNATPPPASRVSSASGSPVEPGIAECFMGKCGRAVRCLDDPEHSILHRLSRCTFATPAEHATRVGPGREESQHGRER